MIRKNNVQAFSNRSPVYGGDSFCRLIKSYSILKASTVYIRSLQRDPTFDRPFSTKLMNGRLIHFFFVFFSIEQVYFFLIILFRFPFPLSFFFYIRTWISVLQNWYILMAPPLCINGLASQKKWTCITWLLTFVMLSRFCLTCRFQSFW